MDNDDFKERLRCVELAVNLQRTGIAENSGFLTGYDAIETIVNAELLRKYVKTGFLPISNGRKMQLKDIFESVLEEFDKA